MDAYEVHKKIQEAIMAVDVYDLRSTRGTSVWDVNIKKGLDELMRKCEAVFPPREASANSEAQDKEPGVVTRRW
jgi:hypothetical protein